MECTPRQMLRFSLPSGLCKAQITGAPIISVRTVVIWVSSGDDTVFSKIQIVHRLINNFLNLFPVATPLYELVYVLPAEIRTS